MTRRAPSRLDYHPMLDAPDEVERLTAAAAKHADMAAEHYESAKSGLFSAEENADAVREGDAHSRLAQAYAAAAQARVFADMRFYGLPIADTVIVDIL